MENNIFGLGELRAEHKPPFSAQTQMLPCQRGESELCIARLGLARCRNCLVDKVTFGSKLKNGGSWPAFTDASVFQHNRIVISFNGQLVRIYLLEWNKLLQLISFFLPLITQMMIG